MASYTMLQNGSSGEDVRKLQNALVGAGYNVGSTGADGIFGSNTAAAVRKYQQDNGLSVDGIAGDKTLGKLYGTAQRLPITAQEILQLVQHKMCSLNLSINHMRKAMQLRRRKQCLMSS